jgi:hypothetical protein
VTGGVQLTLARLPLDPRQLSRIPLSERAQLYRELRIAPEERECAESAVRLIRRGEYLRRGAL